MPTGSSMEDAQVHTDRTRQLATIAIYIVTVAINMAAIAIPLGGKTTGQLSDLYPVPIVPANYVFSIWSVIYTLLIGFIVWQARPGRADDPVLRRLGYLPALTGVLNALWVVLWQFQTEAQWLVPLTVPVMVALLVTLIAIWQRIHEPQAVPAPRAQGWLVAMPFSVYLGWITIATIANVTQTIYLLLGKPETFIVGPEIWGTVILLTGIVIASAVVVRGRDSAYAIVIAWAYLGVAVKQSAAPASLTIVPAVAAAGALLMLAYVVLLRVRPSFGGTPAANPA